MILQDSIKEYKKGLVMGAILKFLAINNTVTTLEVKNELRDNHGDFAWVQKEISSHMNDLATEGTLTFTDNGTFRTYSMPGIKVISTTTNTSKKSKHNLVKIGRSAALSLIETKGSSFFTATFESKKKGMRTINCIYLKDQGTPKLGYVKVKEASLMKEAKHAAEGTKVNVIKQINLQTLIELHIDGGHYKVG